MSARGPMPPATALDEFAAELADPADGGRQLLMVVAHPDDETIGLGGHFGQLPALRIVHVTDGAPRDLRDAEAHGFGDARAYALARRGELHAALHLAGIAAENALGFDLPDQEAMLHLSWLTGKLAALFRDLRPQFVLTHPYEGGHPDHDATAFAVCAACALVGRAGGKSPIRIEMASYHAADNGPVYQQFAQDASCPELAVTLGPEAVALKRRMVAAYASQAATLAGFQLERERFRLAPAYAFAQLPNAGRLQYEAWGLGQGADWLRHVRSALDELTPV